ncbi:CASP-like protein 1 [Daucus carota subsp. sativus]|uniref:CASP-like protein 1 n=1 Tax=Daucus carota subsp. sativus TaxID=79200 RepID=UPI0007EF7FC5|nr:PREDICTED: CASP-like protein 1 [Daucus carota subsp. sativus]
MASISPAVVLELEKNSQASTTTSKFVLHDVILRVFLFATSLTSLVALVTSKQTETIPVPFPPYGASVAAEFTDIPAFIIITTILSFFALVKRSTTSTKLMSCVFSVDVLLLGILASATGAAGEVAYLGLKGNSNVGWHKICNVYDSYCRHIGFSVLTSIFSSMVLSFLIILYIITVSRR